MSIFSASGTQSSLYSKGTRELKWLCRQVVDFTHQRGVIEKVTQDGSPFLRQLSVSLSQTKLHYEEIQARNKHLAECINNLEAKRIQLELHREWLLDELNLLERELCTICK